MKDRCKDHSLEQQEQKLTNIIQKITETFKLSSCLSQDNDRHVKFMFKLMTDI